MLQRLASARSGLTRSLVAAVLGVVLAMTLLACKQSASETKPGPAGSAVEKPASLQKESEWNGVKLPIGEGEVVAGPDEHTVIVRYPGHRVASTRKTWLGALDAASYTPTQSDGAARAAVARAIEVTPGINDDARRVMLANPPLEVAGPRGKIAVVVTDYDEYHEVQLNAL